MKQILYGWTTRVIKCVLDLAIDRREQLGASNIRLELEGTKKFENMLHDKIQELKLELGDSNTVLEKEVLVNEIDTLQCVLGHLFNLKSGSDETLVGHFRYLSEANIRLTQLFSLISDVVVNQL